MHGMMKCRAKCASTVWRLCMLLHTINGGYPNIENYVRKLRFSNLAFIGP